MDDETPINTKNPGHFGPAIIGDEQYQRELAWKAKGANTFGPLVVGPSEPEKRNGAGALLAEGRSSGSGETHG